MKEDWKDIIGYEGYYKVSNMGNIKSLDRVVNKIHFGDKRLVKGSPRPLFIDNKTGYLRVQLSIQGVNRKYLVHRLVANSFIPNPENKKCVNHKNGNKRDNTVGNLEWVTYSENTRHAIDILGAKLGKHFKGESWYKKNKLPCPAKKKVQMFDKNNNLIKQFDSAYEAESETGITHGLVSQYCHGKRNNKKYNFKYV